MTELKTPYMNGRPFELRYGGERKMWVSALSEDDARITEYEKIHGAKRNIPHRDVINCCLCGKEHSCIPAMPGGVSFEQDGLLLIFAACEECKEELYQIFELAQFMRNLYLKSMAEAAYRYLASIADGISAGNKPTN